MSGDVPSSARFEITATRSNPRAIRGAKAHRKLAATLVIVVVAAGTLVVSLTSLSGALTRSMLTHVVLMSALAPATAWWAGAWLTRHTPTVCQSLLLATLAQVAIFLVAHTPRALQAAMATPITMAILHTLLLLAAVWFWSVILQSLQRHRWRCLVALLVTGKLFCLLGVLLVFSPRPLYTFDAASALVADQQLAGLIMLTACPLTYIAASLLLTIRWLIGVADAARPPIGLADGRPT